MIAALEARVGDTLAGLTLPQKAGLLFHTVIEVGDDGELVEGDGPLGTSTHELVVERGIRHFNVMSIPDPASFARWHNNLQRLATSTGSRLPVVLTANPSHSGAHNEGSSLAVGTFSRWPGPLGLAALRDTRIVERHAAAVRRDLRAVGIRGSLSPNLDLSTEPRWARAGETWGTDPELVGAYGAAFVRTMQGAELDAASVFCMAKHFPGGGAQRDGEDPHFAYGREQSYEGGRFDAHLAPFAGALDVGVTAVMPGYGLPVGVEHNGRAVEEVGFGFNRTLVKGLLREQLGFDGVVCTDWGIITDATMFGLSFPAKAWGLENASTAERITAVFDAGCDQLGGESCTTALLEVVASGALTEARLDDSVRRVLRVMLALGLVDQPLVDAAAASSAVGLADDHRAALDAQRRSITVLSHSSTPAGPITRTTRVFAPDIDRRVLERYATAADDPADADLAVLRLETPYEPRSGGFLENRYRSGSLRFAPETVERVRAIAAIVPVVVDVRLDRAAAVAPLVGVADVLLASYGSSDAALLDVLSGRAAPEGRLPMPLPLGDPTAESPDAELPAENTLFAAGHGLGAWWA